MHENGQLPDMHGKMGTFPNKREIWQTFQEVLEKVTLPKEHENGHASKDTRQRARFPISAERGMLLEERGKWPASPKVWKMSTLPDKHGKGGTFLDEQGMWHVF